MSGGRILWTPTRQRAEASSLARYIRWLEAHEDLRFNDYEALWRWSVGDLETFWRTIAEFFEIRFARPPERILGRRAMPKAEWFCGAELNFADQMLRHAETRPDDVAMVVCSHDFARREMTWGALRRAVANAAQSLASMGVGKGDRVVAVLPNTETAMIACLATVSLGAIWSLCAPDMGHTAILDRFRQIEPKVAILQDGHVHKGAMIDRREVLATITAGLPTLRHKVWVPLVGAVPEGDTGWEDFIAGEAEFAPLPVPFDHPIWVVYSSGTTGSPKPILHGHGGILIEGAKQSLHMDIGPDDRFSWLTSSGWIMWNAQTVALGQGATVVTFDGAADYPDALAVWRFIAAERLSYFGAGAAFYAAGQKAGLVPREAVDLGALRSLGSTGSPLSPETYEWIYADVKADVWLAPLAGGTDLCAGFVGGNPMASVRAGEMQCRFLGNATQAFDEDGNALIGEVGELVCTEPLPSMPLRFWGDEGDVRLNAAYFDLYPGIWRHGDWIEITAEGGAIVYGRSDATINRKGLRMGSSEIYRAVEALDEVHDSLVVDLEYLGRQSFMPLFVVLAAGRALDDRLKARINDAIATALSPRFQPNEIVVIDEVPRTLSGKKLEVPVKKLLLGGDAAQVVNRDSMANPESFDTFIAYAQRRAAAGKGGA